MFAPSLFRRAPDCFRSSPAQNARPARASTQKTALPNDSFFSPPRGVTNAWRHHRNGIPMRTIGHFLNGTSVEGTSGRYGDIFNPATGEVQAKVAFATRAELRTAV